VREELERMIGGSRSTRLPKFNSLKGRAEPASVRPFVRPMAVRMEGA
jgi:hypothetical protein